MEHLRAENKRRLVNTGAHEAKEAKLPRSVKDGNVLFTASKFAPPSFFLSLTPSDILSDGLKTYCNIYDCLFWDLAEMQEMGGSH